MESQHNIQLYYLIELMYAYTKVLLLRNTFMRNVELTTDSI